MCHRLIGWFQHYSDLHVGFSVRVIKSAIDNANFYIVQVNDLLRIRYCILNVALLKARKAEGIHLICLFLSTYMVND